jgi:hypothetical protein
MLISNNYWTETAPTEVKVSKVKIWWHTVHSVLSVPVLLQLAMLLFCCKRIGHMGILCTCFVFYAKGLCFYAYQCNKWCFATQTFRYYCQYFGELKGIVTIVVE